MADHIAPGAETSRQQVAAAITAAISLEVQSRLEAVLGSQIASEVQAAVSAGINSTVIGAAVAAYVAANPLANLQQTSGMDADDEVNSATIYAGNYPAKYPSENLWPYELKVKARADANGNLIPLLFKQQLAEIPETPSPVTPNEGAGLDTSFTAFKAEYIVPAPADGSALVTAGSIPADGNVSLNSVAKALQQAVLQTDQTTYDLVLGWAKTNLRRTSRSNFKDLFASFWNTAGSGSVSDWTCSFGINQNLWLAVWQAAQKWNRTSDRDLASEIARGLATLVSPVDEGRLYPLCDDLSAAVSVDGGYAHHLVDGKPHIKVELGRINPTIFKLMKTFTGDSRFDQIREGYYWLTGKQSANSGETPTSKGLPGRFFGVDVRDQHGGLYAITSGQKGWTEPASTDFDDIAADQLTYLYTDYTSFKEPRALTALQAAKQFFVDAWSTGHIYTLYNRAGVAQNAVETASMYYSAIFALSANDASNATANAIRNAKLPTDLAAKVIGGTTYYYLPNQPKGSTYTSSRGGNQAAWLNRAIDINKWADLLSYGAQPNTGTTNPSTGGGTGGGTTTPPVVVVPETPVNLPAGAEDLFVSPQSTLYQWWQSLPAGTKKNRIAYSALKPLAKWVGINWDPNCTSAKEYMDLCRAAGKVGMLLLYSIPSRDFSGGYSAGGSGTFEEYQAHVIKFCQAIGTSKCIVTYEPDSLPDMDALPSDKRAGRVAAMTWAIAYIKATCPNVWLYVDSGHSGWKDAATMVRLLKEVGAGKANGSALNTSNTQKSSDQIVYGGQISAGMGGSYRVIIDTGRNGNDAEPTNEWRNPTHRMYGRNPIFGGPNVTGSANVDGFLWNKTPGESDANYPGEAPNAGELYQNYVYRDNVADNSDTAGLAQRPPTTGVAYAGGSSGQIGN